MSIKAMTLVWERSRAKGSELLVLLAIADYAQDDGREAFPTMRTLAEKSRMTERGVREIIRRLEAAGELEVERNTSRRPAKPGYIPRQFFHVLCCRTPEKISASAKSTASDEGSDRKTFPENFSTLPENISGNAEKCSGEDHSESGTVVPVEPERERTPLKEEPSYNRHSLTRAREDPRRPHPLDDPPPNRLSEQQLAWLDEVIAVYPRHDEGSPRQIHVEWLALNPDEALTHRILDDIRRRRDVGWGDEPRFVPFLARYLAGRMWQERFVAPRKAPAKPSPTESGGPRVPDAKQTAAYLAALRSARG